jgi:hypothetical protein
MEEIPRSPEDGEIIEEQTEDSLDSMEGVENAKEEKTPESEKSIEELEAEVRARRQKLNLVFAEFAQEIFGKKAEQYNISDVEAMEFTSKLESREELLEVLDAFRNIAGAILKQEHEIAEMKKGQEKRKILAFKDRVRGI